MGLLDGNRDFGLAHLLRHIGLQHGYFEFFDIHQILASRRFVLADRVAPLLEHLVDDSQHVGIGQLDTLIDFALLHRGQQQTDRPEARGFPGAHRSFHVFGNLGF